MYLVEIRYQYASYLSLSYIQSNELIKTNEKSGLRSQGRDFTSRSGIKL